MWFKTDESLHTYISYSKLNFESWNRVFVVIYIDRYFDYENFDTKFIVLSSFSRKLCNLKFQQFMPNAQHR